MFGALGEIRRRGASEWFGCSGRDPPPSFSGTVWLLWARSAAECSIIIWLLWARSAAELLQKGFAALGGIRRRASCDSMELQGDTLYEHLVKTAFGQRLTL